MRISFISKVTIVHKAMAFANNTMFLHLTASSYEPGQPGVTGSMKIFPYEHFSPGNRDEINFSEKIASRSQHSGENGVIFVLYLFPL